MKLLLYCTKGKPYLNDCKLINHNKRYFISNTGLWSVDLSQQIYSTSLNGKVVAECDFEVEEINNCSDWYKEDLIYNTNTLSFDELLEKSCLDNQQLDDYLYANKGYAIHIKNLNIYKSPRELSSYTCVKAPQNMQYVYTCYDKNEYVLISIQPQWLCKILNGEKTIEVRKKVLKRMLENDK